MQTRVPELTDLSKEPKRRLDLYGAGGERSRARSRPIACWRGGWRSAACGSCRSSIAAGTSTAICRATSGAMPGHRPACCGLIKDLKQRGLLDDTLVVWGGEFGRTVYSPGRTDERRTTAAIIIRGASRCGWPAAGSRRASVYGETDDFSYNIVEDPVHITISTPRCCTAWDRQSRTITVKLQGLDARLTGVEEYRLLKEFLA